MELWFSEFHAPDVKHSIRVNRHLYSHKSPYQQIDIYETPEFGKVLSLDGNVMLTERDEFIYDEMITHVPMAVHPGIKNVLVIGAGDGGVVHELARYRTIENIDLVEMDEQVVEACRMYLPENASRLDDERVHIYFDNALRFIRRRTDEYDLIIVDSTDPFGPSESYFTKELIPSSFASIAPIVFPPLPYCLAIVITIFSPMRYPSYSPKYAFLTASSSNRSFALPDIVIVPVSST